MLKEVNQNKIFYALISGIILSSFFLFATAFYPLVNSDMAVNVLIADSFNLPHDIYWWGQDRLGSFIPLISQPFIWIGITPILAVSICNYLVITAGFIGFSKLFKQKRTILLFAFLWFFPYQRFIDINVFPLGLSYGLLGFSLVFLLKINYRESLRVKRNLKYVIITAVIWLMAVWISDLMYITLLTFGIAMALRFMLQKDKTVKVRQIFLAYGITMAIIIGIVLVLKSLSPSVTAQFATLNNLTDLAEAIGMVFGGIAHILLFKDELFVSIGGWALLVSFVIAFGLLFVNFKENIKFKNFWLLFFFADFTGIMLVILLSHWVLLNQMGYWYFVAPYISAVIFVLISFEKAGLLKDFYFYSLALLSVFIIGISPISKIYIDAQEYRSTASYVEELDELGEIGIIGDFWHSYLYSMVHPDKVKSTPHQDSDIKNPNRIGDVLSQPRIILVKDNWLEEFPEEIKQFSFTLKKKGEPFFLANATMCEYDLDIDSEQDSIFDSSNLKFGNGYLNDDGTIRFEIENNVPMHIIYGPYIHLKPGKYKMEIYLKDVEVDKMKNEIFFDVVYNYGQKFVIKEFLNKENYNPTKGCFEVTFETNSPLLNVEFRTREAEPRKFTFVKYELKTL